MTPSESSIASISYAVRWRNAEPRPGKHRTSQPGQGGEFLGLKPFWQVPDARRIDLRRSLLDPAGSLLVRRTEQTGSIAVVLACDLSRSMLGNRYAQSLVIARALSRAARRAGDRFGFVGFDETIRRDFVLTPTLSGSAAAMLCERLQELVPAGRSARGLESLAGWLPERRSLLLLLSDFCLPLPEIERNLARLSRHDVVPIVLGAHRRSLPHFGLLRMIDAETGARRLLLARPSLARREHAARQVRRMALDALFLRYTRPAYYVGETLDLASLGQHLLAP